MERHGLVGEHAGRERACLVGEREHSPEAVENIASQTFEGTAPARVGQRGGVGAETVELGYIVAEKRLYGLFGAQSRIAQHAAVEACAALPLVFDAYAAGYNTQARGYVGESGVDVGHGVVGGQEVQHIEELRLKGLGVALYARLDFGCRAQVRYGLGVPFVAERLQGLGCFGDEVFVVSLVHCCVALAREPKYSAGMSRYFTFGISGISM